MKVNLPVTNTERQLDPGKPIVTKTDLKGITTYANQSFIEISGFSREEMIGKNHNIVRHPDMPPEAFADLWETIRNDHPWRGIVKNRCKNGDFYWVEAYVTPIKENGKTVGYMSVRSSPTREQIQSAEQLYKAVREGNARIPKTFRRPPPWRSVQWQAGAMSFLASIILLTLGGLHFTEIHPGPAVIASMMAVGIGLAIGSSLRWRSVIGRFSSNAFDAIEQIAEGNLNNRVHLCGATEFDHILTGLDSMRINMRAIIADIMYSTKTIDEISVWLKQEIGELATRSETQAQRAAQVTDSTENISLTTVDISGNTDETAGSAAHAEEVVLTGQSLVEESIRSSSSVVDVVLTLRDHLLTLDQSIDEIGNISNMITEIAAQTNLLALNAAIEAARAGEQGRGFAVVADEVRKLAERTTSSAANISRITRSVHEATETSIQSMNQVTSEVEQGSRIVQSSRAQLGEILAAIRRTADMANVNASMLKQQKDATAEVAQNMEDIRLLVEANVLSVRGVKTVAINLLSKTAEEQRTLVQHFEIH